MKEIVVISGKGGTGKTSLAASLSVLLNNVIIADCDVDASDLFLLLPPIKTESVDFYSGYKPEIDVNKCIKCGKCYEYCHFNAIKKDITIYEVNCEGCGLCSKVCPVEAIVMKSNLCGKMFISDTNYGGMVHAKLGILEENSGKLVAFVRETAKCIALKNKCDFILIDGPPGIGCALIASLTGADVALVVIEATLSGFLDAKRVIEVAKKFNLSVVAVINKYDINYKVTQQIVDFCHSNDIQLFGKISFDKIFVDSIINGQTVVEYDSESTSAKEIISIYKKVVRMCNIDC